MLHLPSDFFVISLMLHKIAGMKVFPAVSAHFLLSTGPVGYVIFVRNFGRQYFLPSGGNDKLNDIDRFKVLHVKIFHKLKKKIFHKKQSKCLRFEYCDRVSEEEMDILYKLLSKSLL